MFETVERKIVASMKKVLAESLKSGQNPRRVALAIAQAKIAQSNWS